MIGDRIVSAEAVNGHGDRVETNEAEVFDRVAFATTFPALPNELLEGSSAIGLNRSYCNGIFTIPESTQLLTQRPQGETRIADNADSSRILAQFATTTIALAFVA